MRLLWAGLLTLSMLAGCATPGGDRSTFSDSQAADAASITGRWIRESAFVWEGYSLFAVDDKFVAAPAMSRSEHATAKVSPGPHKLAVKVIFNRGGLGGAGPFQAFVPVAAELKPGAKYRVVGKVTGTAAQAWLEDAETKERVSEVGAAPFGRLAQSAPIPIFIPVGR